MGTKLRICALISVIINTCNVTGNRAGIQSLFLIHVGQMFNSIYMNIYMKWFVGLSKISLLKHLYKIGLNSYWRH